MNIRKISEWAVIAIVTVIVTLIATNQVLTTTVKRDKKAIAIEYEVNDDATQLVITAPLTDNCSGGNKTGCFKIEKSKTGMVSFVFNDAKDEWILKQFTLCAGNTKITDACSSDLTLDERLEFFVMDDATGTTTLLTPASGEVELSLLPVGLKTFYLLDQNTIDQEYFYNIEVCPKAAPDDADKCLTLDPPIENKGLN